MIREEEAIEQLQNCKGLIKQYGKDWLDERDIPLLDMAIEALEIQNNCIICPRCGREFSEYEGRKTNK